MNRSRRRRPTPTVFEEPVDVVYFQGGRYRPLSGYDCDRIIDSAFAILQTVGIADASEWLSKLLIAHGAHQKENGRLTFSPSYIEKVLQRGSTRVSLPGFDENLGLEIGHGYVHIGTGGAAVQTLDAINGEYRESRLSDLFDMMRVLDRCGHVHYGVRPMVACDMATPLDLDINTAYACLRATTKPIGMSFENASHVPKVIGLFDLALGGVERFRRQPFCFAVIVHVVSPLSFAREGVDIMRAAIEAGMPLQICNAGQAGATSPASLAGSLAQGLAESLAGAVVVDAIKPGHPCIYAFLPFISDLRTGAMTGGSGESAVANAAAAQLLRRLEMPATVSAGMTDSKVEDVQAGYEKGYSIALAAQAGADMINLSVGMLGSIMVASTESLLIDNDMCGAILRTVRGIEIRDDFFDIESIERVVSGDGHYLGEPQTLQLMKTEYVYPNLGDRKSVADWLDTGSESIWHRAQKRVQNILAENESTHLNPQRDRKIRQSFNIKLPGAND